MNLIRELFFRGAIFVVTGILAGGCTTKSQARLNERNAYLAGQNSALLQQQAQDAAPGVTIIGPVQNSKVPWVAGLTLAQAVATANYLDDREPKQIVITRAGESATMSANVLFNGAVVPLEAGDVIELRQ
jgi:hypothetical protein